MTAMIRQVIAVLLSVMSYDFFCSSYEGVGIRQTLYFGVATIFLLEKLGIHPTYVITGSKIYGEVVLRLEDISKGQISNQGRIKSYLFE